MRGSWRKPIQVSCIRHAINNPRFGKKIPNTRECDVEQFFFGYDKAQVVAYAKQTFGGM